MTKYWGGQASGATLPTQLVCIIYYTCEWGLEKGMLMRKPKKLSFFMLIISYNSPPLSVLEGKNLHCISTKQLNMKLRKHKLNCHSSIIDVSIYLMAYSAYVIKS